MTADLGSNYEDDFIFTKLLQIIGGRVARKARNPLSIGYEMALAA
jgi:hypothetical protein